MPIRRTPPRKPVAVLCQGIRATGKALAWGGSVTVAGPCAAAGAGLPAFLSHFALGPPARRRPVAGGARPEVARCEPDDAGVIVIARAGYRPFTGERQPRLQPGLLLRIAIAAPQRG